ncbi:MAG: MFS transporter [Nocardioidaceae bacterium]
MTTARHLAHLLRGTWFRRLFAVRVTSQFADGVFQVALASYVIFSPERQPSPGAIAGALAVVLLPFSVLGPFVGVLLDRWSRRQVLAVSNFVRVALVAVLALGVSAGLFGPFVLVLVLACLSINRFLLAGLSASLPHVVDPPDLIMANAVTPTAGTLAALTGVSAGTVGTMVWSRLSALDSDVAVLIAAAVLYGVAGALALRIPRAMLGPSYVHERPAAREAAKHVARGLVDGLRHLGGRRPAAHGLMTIGAHRFFFGISTVMLILMHRNYFSPGDADAAFNGLAVAVLVSGAGFVTAALVTPFITERVTLRTWILVLLGAAAVTQVVPGALLTERALLVSSFFLGLASQGIKICVDTLVQAGVDDVYRGRVFALYDVVFNVAFVAAAAAAAVVLPASGRSRGVLVAIAVGYVVTALGYARVSRVGGAARE